MVDQLCRYRIWSQTCKNGDVTACRAQTRHSCVNHRRCQDAAGEARAAAEAARLDAAAVKAEAEELRRELRAALQRAAEAEAHAGGSACPLDQQYNEDHPSKAKVCESTNPPDTVEAWFTTMSWRLQANMQAPPTGHMRMATSSSSSSCSIPPQTGMRRSSRTLRTLPPLSSCAPRMRRSGRSWRASTSASPGLLPCRCSVLASDAAGSALVGIETGK